MCRSCAFAGKSRDVAVTAGEYGSGRRCWSCAWRVDRVARCDQRAKGEQYVRGLLLEGRRKSIVPMGGRLPDGDQQGPQQFMPTRPSRTTVRRRLAHWTAMEIVPEGWVDDDSGLPKDGRLSPCGGPSVLRRAGQTANCQVVVSVNAVTDRASCPLDWRLFLPASWDQDAERRARPRFPRRCVTGRSGSLALNILDELVGWGPERQVVQADGGYGDITAFRLGLEERDFSRGAVCLAGWPDPCRRPLSGDRMFLARGEL